MSANLPIVLSVTSGKGGVGKTNVSVNLALCLNRLGKRCVILDADLGLANVDVVLGMTPENLSRALRTLEGDGVQLSGQQVTITDRAALIAVAQPAKEKHAPPAPSGQPELPPGWTAARGTSWQGSPI